MRTTLKFAAGLLLALLGEPATIAWSGPSPDEGGLSMTLYLAGSADATVAADVGALLMGRVTLRNVGASAVLVPVRDQMRVEVSFVEEGGQAVGAGVSGPVELMEGALQSLRPQEEVAREFQVEVRRSGAGRIRVSLESTATSFTRLMQSPQGAVVRERVESSQLWHGALEASAVITSAVKSFEKFKDRDSKWRSVARLCEAPVGDVGGALALLFSWREVARNEAGVELLGCILRSGAPDSVRECGAAMMLAAVKEGWAPRGIDVLLTSEQPTVSGALQELRLEAAGLGAAGHLSGAFEARGVWELYSSKLAPATREASVRVLEQVAAGPDGWLRRRAEALLRGLPPR